MNAPTESMDGLDICRRYYEAYGKQMLDGFPGIAEKTAAALTGSGSECFGYDDIVSRDHDFDPGFCLFIPDESVLDRRSEFLLERAYAKLPDTFEGLKRGKLSPVGGNRRGVIRTGDFFLSKIGSADGRLDWKQWLSVPSYMFAEAVNGAVFEDRYGELTEIRNRISEYPEDIRRKKLAGNLLLMAQSGPYNHSRCLAHGETGAARLSAFEFVRSAIQSAFLINNAYCPFYKWSFRAMRAMPVLSGIECDLLTILSADESHESENVTDMIEKMSCIFCKVLNSCGLSDSVTDDLEKHAYSVNAGIKNSEIRNLHVLAATE